MFFSARIGKLPSSTARTFGMSWPLLLAVTAVFAVLGSERFKTVLGDADTYWHLAAGRWILAQGMVPTTDPFSHSMPGAPWTAHEWLAEVVLTVVFDAAGWSGLVVLVALALAATLAYTMRFLLSRMEPAHALLFTVLAAGLMVGHLLARPHVLVWPLFAVWLGTLVGAVEAERRPPWALLALMAVWANMHASYLLGLGLGAALGIDAVLSAPAARRHAIAAGWAAFLGLATAAAVLTPSGWHGLLYPFQVSGMSVALDAIGEWSSPDFHQPQTLELWLMLLLALACSGGMRLPWLRLIVVMGLVHLALKHQRHIAVLGLATPFLLAAPLARHWKAMRKSAADAEVLDRLFAALALPARPGAIAATGLAAALLIGASLHSQRFAPAVERTPEAALRAARAAGVQGPVLNSYDFGGFLIYRGVPVFIDGRADMYGDRLLKLYIEALGLHDADSLARLMDGYGIRWSLLEPGTPAIMLLDRLPGWRRLYADKVAVVHVRELPQSGEEP